MNESKHPELYQLMSNLCQAGMSIGRVIEHGFTFAQDCLAERQTMSLRY